MTRPVALVLRALGLGDFLTGIPALKLLRQALPDHQMVLAAPAVLAPLVGLIPDVDSVFARGELQSLTDFGRAVDVGVDLHGKGPESRRLLAELRPGRLVGFADPAAGLPGPTWRPDEHEVTRWCRLVAAAFPSVPVDETAWPGVAGSLPLSGGQVMQELPMRVTVVHPGAAAASRRWPADRFAAVASELSRSGHHVLVTGGPAEVELAQYISRTGHGEPMIGLSLLQLAALVASARLVVCGDTGVAHLASAYRTPSVSLFGPVSPALWGPPTVPRHAVLWHGDGTGDPHGEGPDPALLKITVSEVLEAAERVDSSGAPVLSGRAGSSSR